MANKPRLLPSIRPKQSLITEIKIEHNSDTDEVELTSTEPMDPIRDLGILMCAVCMVGNVVAKSSGKTLKDVLETMIDTIEDAEGPQIIS